MHRAGGSSAKFDHPVNNDAFNGCRAFLSLDCKLIGCRRRGGEGKTKCPDKSQYTLFNPTPANCLREFDPDRPDVTDSPFYRGCRPHSLRLRPSPFFRDAVLLSFCRPSQFLSCLTVVPFPPPKFGKSRFQRSSLSANSRTESLSKKADISLGYGLFRVVLFSSPSEKNAITPLDGASCWNALPHNGWKRLGNVGFGIEAEMPI